MAISEETAKKIIEAIDQLDKSVIELTQSLRRGIKLEEYTKHTIEDLTIELREMNENK